MTHWLVANPQAGDNRRNRDFWLAHLAAAGIHHPECGDPQDERWQQQVGADDVVLVAGGDGSVNHMARLCLRTGATLGVLPSGTANDFARNLELPEDPADLCRLVADGPVQHVDVVEFGHQLFLNVAHIGLGTLPVRQSSNHAKRLLGRYSYVAGLLQRINARRGFRATIQCDKGQVEGRWLSVAVANGAFFGGGNQVPGAAANDGQLDVIAVRPRPLLQLLLTFLTVQLSRKAPRRTSTMIHLKGRRCAIYTRKPKTITADGDVAGTTPLLAVCRAQRLKVIARTLAGVAG
ncbi:MULTISPECIES: diacylglycerol/lipid kinase family protein [Marinobacter]|uniref:Diacylglycerol kinase n=1 Tax=Marinobacter profundi TaxID=2666256 RepID=A0A2G1UM56_9GAMM|nr:MULTISPECIES: YegS/Rv2252/BmrU family lipid kinase [Marinobacter]MBD3655101.1 YegS/Rv2252/BmrU family lipid kinase [Marinobacter sp.]PHQ15543.1 diacylglycerol kinase [Marinobacter profundi]